MNEPSHYANYLKALRDVPTVKRLRDRRVAAKAAKAPLYEELERRLELLAVEEQDVARLEGFSFASLMAKLTKAGAADLARERQEELEARLRVDEQHGKLAAIEAEIETCTHGIEARANAEAKYERAVDRMLGWMSNTTPEAFARAEPLRAQIEAATVTAQAIALALEAGARAREHLEGAREAMAGVEGVAWFDLLVDETGISDVIKSERLEIVRAHHGSAHTRLEQFRAACAGVLSVDLPEQDTFLRDGPGRWLHAFDWVDNVFAEITVLSAVQRTTKGLDESLASIARAMDALGRLRDEVESELGLAEAGFEALMRDAAAPSSTR